MTLLAEPETPETIETLAAVVAPQAPRVVSLRQIVAVNLAALLVLVVAALVFEDPVAHLWYNARQHQRAISYNQQRKATATGQTLAILQIPSVGVNEPIVEGDSVDLLRGGPGHAPTTPRPGDVGNSVVFGHRKGWGGPFSKIGQLQTGAAVYVQIHGSSDVLLFAVTSVSKVSDDRPLLAPATDRRLTLVTSSGGRFSSGYLVVSAVSGSQGRLKKPSRGVASSLGKGPLIFNRQIGLLVLRAAGALAVIMVLRRRYRPGLVTALSAPLVVSALLALLLYLDRLLPPLG